MWLYKKNMLHCGVIMKIFGSRLTAGIPMEIPTGEVPDAVRTVHEVKLIDAVRGMFEQPAVFGQAGRLAIETPIPGRPGEFLKTSFTQNDAWCRELYQRHYPGVRLPALTPGSEARATLIGRCRSAVISAASRVSSTFSSLLYVFGSRSSGAIAASGGITQNVRDKIPIKGDMSDPFITLRREKHQNAVIAAIQVHLDHPERQP